MKHFISLALLISSFALTSCQVSKNTTTGNPLVSLTATGSSTVTTVAIHLWEGLLKIILPDAYALPAPSSMIDAEGNTVTLSHIWITIGEFEFKVDEFADGSEVDGSDVDFSGPYTVDMLDPAPSPIQTGQISVAALRRVKVKLIRTQSPPSSAPIGLTSKSIYIEGTVNGNPFSYSTQDETVMEVSGPNLIEATENSRLLLQLRTANLIKRIKLSAVTMTTQIDDSNRVNSTNPCPDIAPSADDLFTCFRKGLETESTLGRDDNGNNELDNNETTVD